MKKKTQILIIYYVVAALVIAIGFIAFSKTYHSDGNVGSKFYFDGEITETATFPAHDNIRIRWYGIKLYSDESGWEHDYLTGGTKWERKKGAHPEGIIITSLIILLLLAFPFIYIFGFKSKVDNARMKNKTVKEKKKTSGIANELKEYKFLLDEGMITEEEYQKKKEELLKISSSGAQNQSMESEVKKPAETIQNQTVEGTKNWSFDSLSDSGEENPSDFMD